MLILQGENIKKYYGDRLIIAFESFKIQQGDKIGVVGPNGAGKSTLLDILAGDLSADEGIIQQYGEIAYIKQFLVEDTSADGKLLKEFAVQLSDKPEQLSGGEYTRLKLAAALSSNSSLLLADEPSANLDYRGVALLKQKFQQVETLVIISHDRDLLDQLCKQIIEVNDGQLRFYKGNYSFYQHQKELEMDHEWFEYDQYISEKSRLENAVREQQIHSKSMRKAPSRMGNSEARLHKGKTSEKKKKLDSGANRIKTRLDKLDVKAKPREIPDLKMDFTLTHPPANKIVISSANLSFSYVNHKVFDNVSFNIYNGMKTAIIGDNGSGKTTLLNLINHKDAHIHMVPRAVCGYFCQGFENLDDNKSILENIMQDSIQNETTARTILGRLLIPGDNVHKKVAVLSGGEKIKVALARIMVSNANILLLDEPTNYLDMPSIQALERVLVGYAGTVLFVSHDRAFINAVANRLLILKNNTISDFGGNLQEFEEKRKLDSQDNHNSLQKSVLQMRLTEITAKMSLANTDRDALEAEFKSIVEIIKGLG